MSTENAQLTVAPAGALALPASAAALIPIQHHEAFHALKEKHRERVSMFLTLFRDIESAPEGKVAAITRLALMNSDRGFSSGNLRAFYYKWIAAGRDWRVLVPKHGHESKLPREFLDEVKRRTEATARSARQAILSIREDWKNGVAIPGFGTWRDWFAAEFPERDVPARWPLGLFPPGWSVSQLYTKQSSKAERILKRRGFAAAKRYLPHVIRDRSALRPLELIAIDDFETDQLVRARHPQTGRAEICTCTGLLAIDVATGRKLCVALKPRFKSEEGRRIAITRHDVQFLLYGVFSEHGLPTHGCTVLCENAAAAISADFELALESLLGVQVARTGLIHDKTLRNGFVESGGKPWEKGWIESTFNLVHNLAGSLPGQKGASYQLRPGDLEAKLLFAEKLIAIEGLTPAQIDELKVPFWTDAELLTAYEGIFAKMDRRTDHRMQGFLEIFDYRLPDGSEIVTESTLALRGLSRDELTACEPVPRRESPIERWARLGADCRFVKVAPHALALLLLTPKQVELRNHKITFTHQATGYTFADADSPVMQLPEGTKLLAYFDATRPDTLFCTTLERAYVGAVKRRGAIDLRDAKALATEAGEISRLIATCVLNPVRARHAAEDARQLADDAHNLAKLREWSVPESAIPARLLPPKTFPATADQNSGPDRVASATTSEPTKADRINPNRESTGQGTLSAKLARKAPARDAFAAHRDALARGVAGHCVATETANQQAAEAAAEEAKRAERGANMSMDEFI